MSKFEKLFKDKCEIVPLLGEFDLGNTCPECLPDLGAPRIDWFSTEGAYFDPKTCEYILNYLSLSTVMDLARTGVTLEQHAIEIKKIAALRIFRHFARTPPDFDADPSLLNNVFISPENIIVDRSNMIRIRVSMYSSFFSSFDQIVSESQGPDEGTEELGEETDSDLPPEIVINDTQKNHIIHLQIIKLALDAYQLKYEISFAQNKGERAIFFEDRPLEVFTFNKLKDELNNFKESLDFFLEENGFKLLDILDLGNLFSFDKTADVVRIVLDNSDPESPLKIKQVFASFEGCPEQELLIGLDKFINDTASMKSAIFFYSRLPEAYQDVAGEGTIEWLEFAKKHVFPKLLLKGVGEEELENEIPKGDGPCSYNVGKILEDILKNLAGQFKVSFWDLFALQIDKDSCSQDPQKSDPNVKQFFKIDAEKDAFLKEQYNIKRQQLLKNYNNNFSEPPAKSPKQTDDQYKKTLDLWKKNKEEAFAKIDAGATAYAKKQRERVLDKRKWYEHVSDPLKDEWDKQWKSKENKDRTTFEIFDDLNYIGSGDWVQDFTDLVGLCGLNEGMQKALGCLLKQIPFDEAIKIAMKIAFETLPTDFDLGIPEPKQQQIKEKVLDKIGRQGENIPWPWQFPKSNQEINQRKAVREETERQRRIDFDKTIKQANKVREDLNQKYREQNKLGRQDFEQEYLSTASEEEKNLLLLGQEYQDALNASVFEEGKDKQVVEFGLGFNIREDEEYNRTIVTPRVVTSYKIEEYKEETTESMIRDELYKKYGKEKPPTTPSANTQDIARDLNEILGEIINAYVEVFAEMFSIDELLEVFESVPAIQFILTFLLGFIKCPSKVLKDYQNPKIKQFKLDICDPTEPIIPSIIPNIELYNPFSVIVKNFIGNIKILLRRILSYIIKIIIDFLDSLLCKALDFAGATVGNLLSGQFNFLEPFKKAFCPDSSDQQASDLLNDLMNSIGLSDNEVNSAVECLKGALAGMFTERELATLLLQSNPPEELVQRVANAILIGCPRFADVLGNPAGVRNFFDGVSNMIPEEGRDRLLEYFDYLDDLPLYETICLTSEELEEWDRLRAGNLEDAGLSQEEAAQQVENYNNRAKEALEDILRNLSDVVGPDGISRSGIQDALIKAINELLTPNAPDPCDLKPGESGFGNKAFGEPQEVVLLQDDISNTMLDQIKEAFERSYGNSPNHWEPWTSFLSRIMRDTVGTNYLEHNAKESGFWTRMDYHHSKDSEAVKEGKSFWEKTFGSNDVGLFPEDKGYFPETIGLDLQNNLLEDIEYQAGTTLADSFQYSFNYRIEDEQIYNILYRSENLSSRKNPFDYEIFSTKYDPNILQFDTEHREVIAIDEDVAEMIGYSSRETDVVLDPIGYVPKFKIFENFITEKLSVLSKTPNIEIVESFYKMCDKVFDSVKSLCIAESEGFIFGFEDEDLTEDELRYVGPDGEEPYEEYFSEEDRILGRAKVPNDRVYFLDPEKFGGSYTVPPYYVVPKEMHGWKRLFKELAPEEEQCDPKTEGILKFSQIKEHANNLRNTMNLDPRVGKSVEICFVEKPFDKILNKNAASSVDAISRIHIRMAIAQCLTLSMPVVSKLKFNMDNYDHTFLGLVYDRMYGDLTQIDPFIGGTRKIRKNRYAMLVFEQLVQSFEREIVTKLPEGEINGRDISSLSPEVQEAYSAIVQIRDNYDYLTISPTRESKKLPLLDRDADLTSLLENEDFFAYAIAYENRGEGIFLPAGIETEEAESPMTLDYNAPTILGTPPTPIFFNPFFDWKLYCKIFAIRVSKKHVDVLVKELIKLETMKVIEAFYESYDPKIDSLMRNITTSDIFYNNNLVNLGTTQYKKAKQVGSVIDIGDAEDVITDIDSETPWQDSEDEEFRFKIEKYIRITHKDQPVEELELLAQTTNGVTSIQQAQELVDMLKELYGEKYVSNMFGDAVLSEDEESYSGTIGFKYGLRIVMTVPKSLMLVDEDSFVLEDGDREISMREKAYFTNLQNEDYGNSSFLSIPMCSVELETKDMLIKDVNFMDGLNKYDLDCLINKLIETKEYRLFFKYFAPVKGVSSFCLLSSYRCFMNSIGVDDNWVDAGEYKRRKDSDLESVFLKEAQYICRRYFVGFYESNKFLSSRRDGFQLPQIDFPDLWSILFGFDWIPDIRLNLPTLNFNFPHKRIEKNPFNKNKELCETDTDKIIK